MTNATPCTSGGCGKRAAIGSIPIGQGISVTASQMLEVYNVIANGGTYVAPRLVAGTIDSGGARHDAPPSEQRRVVSAETAAKVNGMLENVVASKDGTGFLLSAGILRLTI